MGCTLAGPIPRWGCTVPRWRGDKQRTPIDTLLDPKFAVEHISEVPGASKAHLEVVNWQIPYIDLLTYLLTDYVLLTYLLTFTY